MNMKDIFGDKSELVIYDSGSDLPRLNMTFDGETLWLTQDQIAQLFGVNRSSVSRHIGNIYRDEELEPESTSAEIARVVDNRPNYVIKHYNLDVVISVGYRVSSKLATRFRKWATNVLKERIATDAKGVIGLSKDEQRLLIGDRVAVENNELLDAAILMGVENQHTFFDAGYRGMYKKRMSDIKIAKGLGADRLLDRAGVTELAANEFRITQTNDMLRKMRSRGRLVGEVAAITAHYTVGEEVRKAIESIGGSLPEDLPVEPDTIHEVRKRLGGSSEQRKLT